MRCRTVPLGLVLLFVGNCSVHVEELLERYADGRVVLVRIHDVGHHVPPFLRYRVYIGGVLAVGSLGTLLLSE